MKPLSPVKSYLQRAVLVGLLFTCTLGYAQLKSQCETCFTSEIISTDHVSSQCTNYELKVYYSGKCDHALSHVTVAVPTCAAISNLWNDQNYSEVIGYDPTTGLTGFKIDNTTNFGSSSLKSFIVKFTLCATSNCPALTCWSPQVAYKAATCFELDSLQANCTKLSAHLEQTNITCANAADGKLNVVIDSGVAPFQYLWSNGSTTSSIDHLSPGNYSVQISDAAGSSVSLAATISQPSAIVIQPSVMSATCNGASNGSIDLTVSGGTGSNYTYLWNTGATTSSLDSIKSGNYSVTVKDSIGCETKTNISVGNQKKILLSVTSQLPGCNKSNGSLTLTASGGSAPYSYLWSTGDTTSTVSNLAAGIYSVTMTDAEGCFAVASYSLHENNTLKLTYAVTPTSCLDNGSGAINITVSGGTAPYSFLWSNSATTEDIQNLTAGLYTITVTDSAGCQVSARISVYKKTFQISTHITQPKCYGDSTGSILLSPSGGVAPYQFLWSTGSTSDSLTNLSAGIYMVTVTDSTGCSSALSLTITNPRQMQATISTSSTGCNSFSVDLNVTGGTQPYQYQWSNGGQTQDLTNVGAGTYQVVVTDANSCFIQQQVTIDSTATWSCAISALSQAPVCLSSGNRIFTTVTGAQYLWSISSSDGSWLIQSGVASDTLVYQAGNSSTTATFSLTITKNGCSQTCTYLVSACSSSGSTGGSHNENCKDAFSSAITKNSDDGTCAKYTLTISTDGNSQHGLSHAVIGIPCGQLSDYSDSGNYPLVVGTDPTTGITGLKVDNVSNFGDQPASITVEFTICYSSDCASVLQNWSPVVAYKAGLCIAYDTISVQSGANITAAYPNPFQSSFQIDVTPPASDYVSVDLYSQYDQKVLSSVSAPVTGNVKNQIKVDASSLQPGIYIYKMRTSTSVYYGRVLKIN